MSEALRILYRSLDDLALVKIHDDECDYAAILVPAGEERRVVEIIERFRVENPRASLHDLYEYLYREGVAFLPTWVPRMAWVRF